MDKEITREDHIVVGQVYDNSYGDLLWTDKGGKEYKVSNKRRQYFEKIILPDTAVTLSYAEAYGREYIYRAVTVEGELPPPAKPSEPLLEHQKEIRKAVDSTVAPQERGMWEKEAGEWLRSGKLDMTKPVNKALNMHYWQRLLDVLGIEAEKP